MPSAPVSADKPGRHPEVLSYLRLIQSPLAKLRDVQPSTHRRGQKGSDPDGRLACLEKPA